MITLTVRGLPRSMTESDLQAMFAEHGRVHGLRMARDLFSGECRGFAELQMEGHEARAAVAALDGSFQAGGALRVSVGAPGPAKGRRGKR